MRRALLVFFITLFGFVGSSHAQQDVGWTFTGKWLLLKRGTSHNASIMSGNTTLNSSQFTFNHENSFEISAARTMSFGDLEFRFFQVDGFQSSQTITAVAQTQQSVVGNEIGTGDATISFGSRLYNAEANCIRPSSEPWLNWFVGIRYVRLEEDSLAAVPNFTARFDLESDLIGFQVGADALVYTNSRTGCSIQFLGKVGIYGAEVDSHFNNSAPAIDLNAGTITVATVAEMAFLAEFPITSSLSFEASYHLLWLEGVGLASEQYPNTVGTAPGSTQLNMGSVFFYGYDFGFVYRW